MEKIGSNGLQRFQKVILYAFIFSLPLFQKLATILLVLLAVISLFNLTKKIQIDYRPYLIPAVLYVLISVSLFYSENFELKHLENRASFLALPLVFLSMKIDAQMFEKIIKYFVFGCLAAVISCYANALCNAISWIDEALVFRPVVSGDFSFFEAVVRDGNYFFSGFFSMFHDTIYFALFLNTAIVGILTFQLCKKNNWYILILLLFILTIFQLSSKIGIITCFLIFAIYLIFRTKTIIQRVLIPFTILLIGVLFFQLNPRGKSMINKFKTEGLTIEAEQRFGYTLRLMSWNASKEIIKKNPIVGVGVGDAQKVLNETYAEKGYTTPLRQNLNAHNAFIQIFLECGVFGFLLVTGMLFYLFSIRVKEERQLSEFKILFVLIVLLAFLFESVLNRFSGIVFFMFFYGLLINRYQYVGKN